ncbi:hypothetical protein N7462_011545 [Penicillium macrosclerotiorum]|uniref:uncharacterized protein n=1 Tax=Penicillium macrosclerotiorum TaxID=303699 RepID=UPI0025466D32|nr:uncharacterized protein N7462_011545 [Penicillium macrosclerotiorum]KAJ5664732.1 hypothetical protein N7462_011545 [Penicillium macrosclerotiorum]
MSSKNSADRFEGYLAYSIIHSPSFTFLVGPKHTKLTIQSGLAQHVSKPLHNLMNNGHTRESKHRIAVLEEEDAETFVAFCEYAYTGDYNVPQLPVPQEEYRAGVADSAPSPGNSWRGTYRSDSVSSGIPPPAPSPPPESIGKSSQTAKLDSPPMIEEDIPAEAAAEVEAEAAVETQEVSKEDENSDVPTLEPLDQPQKPAEYLNESPNAEYPGTAPEQGCVDAEVTPTPTDEDDRLELPEEWSKPSKLSKKDKKKKKQQQQKLEEERPASLTPPSTPPPEHPSNEVHPEPVVETPAGAEKMLPREELKPVPAEEPYAEHETEPEPEVEPKIALEEAPEEWEEPSAYPTEDAQRQDEWEADDAENQGRVYQSETNETQETTKPVIDMSFAKQTDSSPRTPGLSLWDEFAALQYNYNRPSPSANTNADVSDASRATELPYLTFHAKVYVFATRYLIPALAQLCLRKLHRDLVHLSFADEEILRDPYVDMQQDVGSLAMQQDLGSLAMRQAPMVLDLLRYAYTRTTRLEPINPTSATQLRENELRRLVVHYAACKVKELARYHAPGDSETATPSVRPVDVKLNRTNLGFPKSLRSLLDMTPELASDLVYRMM